MSLENEVGLAVVTFKIIEAVNKLSTKNEKLVTEINEMKEKLAKLTAGANTTTGQVKGDFVSGTSHEVGKAYSVCGSATVPDNASIISCVPTKLPPGIYIGPKDETTVPSVEPSVVEATSSLPSVDSEVALAPLECQFCFSSHLDGECVYQLWLPVLTKSEPEVRPVRKFIRVINKWVIALPKGCCPLIIGVLNDYGEIEKMSFKQLAEAMTDPDVFSLKISSKHHRLIIENRDPELAKQLRSIL